MVPLRPGSQSSSNPPLPPHLFRKRKTMRLSRPLSDLVKYTKAVRVHDIETQGKRQHPSTSVVRLENRWIDPCFCDRVHEQLAGVVAGRDGGEPDPAAEAHSAAASEPAAAA